MAQLRLYRKIYSVTTTRTGSTIDQTYTLIDPYSISASTFYIGDSSNVVETLNPQQESTGVYYVDIDPNQYSWDRTYNLNWNVLYTASAPVKKLVTTFRFNPINIGSEVVLEIIDNSIELEVK